jgi:hypothetical protein
MKGATMQTIPAALAGFSPAKVEAALAKVQGTPWIKYAGGDAYFALWMALVDHRVMRRVGLSVLDLSDQPFTDWYEDGITPAQAAELTVHGNAEFCGEDW